ncbi:MAG: hypothetical protein D9V47_11630 [Clostridia bacterium]|nr:MAG: hypothetical protein D9V47_11630 [Clostridia bacterium]
MPHAWRNDLVYKIIAVLLALALWFYVNDEKNPRAEDIYRVPLEVEGLPGGLVVADKPQEVEVRVQGRSQRLAEISARQIRAVVDLPRPGIGANIEPVEVRLPAGLELVTVTPSQANIKVDRITEKQFPVQVELKGRLPAGYRVLPPVARPEQVMVGGPETILDRISVVRVTVDVSRADMAFHQSVPVTASDAEGRNVSDWLQISPATVEVLVPVVRDLPSREVEVRVQLQGEPARGFRLEQVVVVPAEVLVFGPEAVLEKLPYLVSDPVDISGISSDRLVDLKFSLPSEVSLPSVQVQALIRVVPEGTGSVRNQKT